MSAAPQNSGPIVAKRGTYSDSTCTTQYDLVRNQATKPVYRNFLERRDGRYLMTLLTSGAMGPSGYNNVPTKTGIVDGIKIKSESKGIGNIAYRWDVLGRIEKKATVVSQVGSSDASGSFTLKMLDTYLYKNQVVRFPSGRRAITLSQGTGSSASGFLYNFQMLDGTAFVFATDCSIKSCFPEYTAYSEGSLKSDSRDKHPDTLMNHMTTQRQTISMTGSAQSDVLWYEYADGAKVGWMWWKVNQGKAQFAMQNERHKKFGVSSMKGSDGSLLTTSTAGNDPDTGLPIIIGDGVEEQISASNVFVGSGTNGECTIDDFTNAMTAMEISSNQVGNITWVAITGTPGFVNAQQQMTNLAGNQNAQVMQMETAGSEIGVGYTFTNFSFAGNKMWFIKDPMFDDVDYFPETGNDGKSLMANSYMILGINTSDKPTMEIICKEANGIKRDYVEAEYIGLTGQKGLVQSEADATKVALLKEDMVCVYNPSLMAMLYKAS